MRRYALATIGLVATGSIALVLAGCGGGESTTAASDTTTESTTTTTTAALPKPLPADLERPLVGVSVPAAWIGRWHEDQPPSVGDGFDWHLLPATSAVCRSLTAGRRTCWTVGATGSTTPLPAYAGGAITAKGGKVVLRMTWVEQRGKGLECFSDDAYTYAYTKQRIKLLPDSARHCFRDLPDDPFSGLTRVK